MALGLTPTTLSFIAGNGSPAPSAGVTDVLQNGASVVENGVARVTVPTKTSDLQNDSGFITAADIPAIPTKTSELQNDSGFVTSSAIPTKTSDLQNDSGFVTAGEIRQLPASTSADSGEVLTVDAQGNPGWAQLPSPVVSGVQDVTVDGVSVVSQGVAEITMPSVPTKTSQLQNDSGFVTSSAIPTKTSDLQNDSGFITSSSLPTVDQTYNAASTNAQSGVAVAQAIASVTPGGSGASFYAPPVAFTQTTSDANVSTTRMKAEYALQLQEFMNANKGKYLSVTAYAKHAYGTGQEPDGVFINFLSTINYSTGVARDYHAVYAIRCASSLNVAYSNVTGSATQVLGPLATEEMTTVSVVNTVTQTAQQSLHYTIYAMLFQIVG